jgi:hypothetical protein
MEEDKIFLAGKKIENLSVLEKAIGNSKTNVFSIIGIIVIIR